MEETVEEKYKKFREKYPIGYIVEKAPWYTYGELVGYADIEIVEFEEREIGVCPICKGTYWFITNICCGYFVPHGKVVRMYGLEVVK